jgi:hypothetical protein
VAAICDFYQHYYKNISCINPLQFDGSVFIDPAIALLFGFTCVALLCGWILWGAFMGG